jgi:hypothetical protein
MGGTSRTRLCSLTGHETPLPVDVASVPGRSSPGSLTIQAGVLVLGDGDLVPLQVSDEAPIDLGQGGLLLSIKRSGAEGRMWPSVKDRALKLRAPDPSPSPLPLPIYRFGLGQLGQA